MPTECPLVALRRNRKISRSAEHLDLTRHGHGPQSRKLALRQRGHRRVALPAKETPAELRVCDAGRASTRVGIAHDSRLSDSSYERRCQSRHRSV